MEENKEEEEEEEEEEGEAPSHLPFAPTTELHDTSTTVDPSYIISLIRKLLPQDLQKKSQDVDSANYVQGSQTGCVELDASRVCNGTEDIMVTEGRNLVNSFVDKNDDISNDYQKSSDSKMDYRMSQEFSKQEIGGSDAEKSDLSYKNDPREEAGCILWDLSANETHAEFMVSNLLLDVLLANLQVSPSVRITEICLGIIGNLACHDVLSCAIVSKDGLLETVVQQLFLDDSTCLSELFRLFDVGLQGSTSAIWTEALLSEQVLLRILWIIGNTLNSVLLEKSIEFLLTVVNNQEVSSILLQPLIKLGFPSLLASLVAGERSKLADWNSPDRSSINESILGLVESVSATDDCSQIIVSNEHVLSLVCAIVKLPDKIEIATSCVSAVLIIANLLVDEDRVMSELSQDLLFFQGLLEILPFVSDDPQARNALWCVVARLLGHVLDNNMNVSTLYEIVSVFARKSHLIIEDIDGHPMEDDSQETKSSALATSLKRMTYIVEKWISEKTADSKTNEGDDTDKKVVTLLNICHKYVTSSS